MKMETKPVKRKRLLFSRLTALGEVPAAFTCVSAHAHRRRARAAARARSRQVLRGLLTKARGDAAWSMSITVQLRS